MSDKCRAIVYELWGFVNVYRGNVRAESILIGI